VLFAGKFVSSISRHWFDVWGAMAEEEEERADGLSDLDEGEEKPEDGLSGLALELCEMADEALSEELLGIVKNLRQNAREKHAPSASTLLNLATKADAVRRAMRQARVERHESLAKLLWQALKRPGSEIRMRVSVDSESGKSEFPSGITDRKATTKADPSATPQDDN